MDNTTTTTPPQGKTRVTPFQALSLLVGEKSLPRMVQFGDRLMGWAIARDEAIEVAREQESANAELLSALKTLFADYKALADSGDAGSWRLEEQPAGIIALSAIAKEEGRAV